MTFFIACW